MLILSCVDYKTVQFELWVPALPQAGPAARQGFFFYMNLTLPEVINSSALVKPWLSAWRFVIMSKSRLQIRHLHGFQRLALFDGQWYRRGLLALASFTAWDARFARIHLIFFADVWLIRFMAASYACACACWRP